MNQASTPDLTPFSARHIGVTDPADQAVMLKALGLGSLDELIAAAVPVRGRTQLAGRGVRGRSRR